MKTDDLIAGLPGEALVRKGLADVYASRQTAEAYLVRIARPRLSRAGLLTDVLEDLPADAELCLYDLLRTQGGDAYSRYNALLRELISFENALDRRLRGEPSDAEGIAREPQERRGRFH